ncbi:hypothetical protein OSB04_028685 [Centaurea solstitialis]|uniref:CCHC-type domain-containing protein n=1 Tax=Centaurea solstitialis TaxID=347529 RepID=A0AA38W9I0_9ASTR|nr:hypothetical protein OSB04_028685 [Centaurea solstitialis]
MFVCSDSNPQSSSPISKNEAATSDQPPNNSNGKNLPIDPPKPKIQNHKTSKVLGGGPTGSGAKKSAQSPTPRIKVDLITKPQEKTPLPPQTKDIGIIGPGPADQKLKKPKGPSKSKTYRNCYHCSQNDHIASKCPHATKAEKAAKLKKGPKANKSAKGNKPLIAESVTIPDPVKTKTSVKTEDVASSLTTHIVSEATGYSVIYVPDDSSFFANLSIFKKVSTINSPLHLLHIDLFGPVNIQSMGAKRFTLVIVDEYSRYTWVFLLGIMCRVDKPSDYTSNVTRHLRVTPVRTYKSNKLDETQKWRVRIYNSVL